MKIIWIDDDTAIIDSVMKAIIDEKNEMIYINSVKDALDSIEIIRRADIIIMDVIIPKGGVFQDLAYIYPGIQLLHKLREEFEIKIPVIIFSVVDPKKVVDQLIDMNVAEYIRKPSLQIDIKNAINKIQKENK
jgi:DNA-binding NarL/FixJ family response regulator